MAMRRVYLSVFAAACSFAESAGAQSLYPPPPTTHQNDGSVGETARKAMAAALAHHPDLEVAASRLQAAKAERLRAIGKFLPSIEASASYTDDAWRSDTLDTLNERNGTTLGITASQPLFQGLSAFNSFRAARARLSQSDFALLSAREEIALAAAQVHAGVILARQIVEHRQKNLDLVQKQLEITEKRQKAGAQSRTGVEQAKMRRAQAQVDLSNARANLAARESAYARIVGYAPPIEMAAEYHDDLFALGSKETAVSVALANNPALNAARAGAEAASHAKDAAKGGFAPRLALEGSYFRRYGDGITPDEEEEYQLVARMRLPIFAQGNNIADLKQAGAAEMESNAQLRAARLIIEEALERNWRQLDDAKARRHAAQNAIDAAVQSVKGLEIEYETGRRSVIDVLDGQRDLIIALISHSQAEHDARVIQFELAAAAGRLLAYAENAGRQQVAAPD